MLLFTPIVVVVVFFDVLVAVASLDLRVLDVFCETRGSDVIVRFDVGVT